MPCELAGWSAKARGLTELTLTSGAETPKEKGRRAPSEPCDPSDEHVCQSTKYRSRTRADFLTWNVGVLATERIHEILTIMPVVGLEHTQVVAFQGSNCKEQAANHALGVIIRRARGKIGVLDVHLPPRTAIPEA